MSQLNVLFVVYAFPPAGGVGTLRAASLARYLPAEGIRLDVLTTRNPSSVGMDYSLLNDIPPEVTIHRTFTVDVPFALKKRIKRLLTGRAHSPEHAGAPASTATKPGLISRLLQNMFLPDPQVTWLPVLTRAARRIVRERNIDVVVITGAPYSAYLLARPIRKCFPGLPIVLDFRDEWVSTSCDPSSFHFSRTERARQFAIRAEADVVARATAVVAVNRGALQEMRLRYPDEPPSKFYCISNGFDGSRIQMAGGNYRSQHGDKTVVTYLGTVSVYSDPTALVSAVQSLSSDVRSTLLFRFIGHIEGSRYRDKLLELGDNIELRGYMPQRDALNALNETDYVLVLTHDPLNVPAKFYDYLGSGKPILACIHPRNDISVMLEELQAGWWADSRDVDIIRQLLINAAARINSLETTFRPDRTGISQYERKPLARRYAALLHSLADRRDTTEEYPEHAVAAGREA